MTPDGPLPDEIRAALEGLAQHGILRWEPHAEGVMTQLLPLAPGEGTRLFPLLSPEAKRVWRALVDVNQTLQRLNRATQAELN